MRVIFVLFTLTFFTSFLFGQCNQTTNISSTIVTQSCPSGTVTYQVSFSSSIPNGNNSLCYGYTITNPDGSQQTTNIGPVNQSNSSNKNWTHTFNVTINCTQGLILFLNAWSNQNCGGMMCDGTISKVLVLAPLPVELLYFTVKATREGNLLAWATAKETNNQGFNIEYSQDAMTWETLTFIKGNGNTQHEVEYNFWDKELNEGAHYYRLQQIDFDGTTKYSNTVFCTTKNGFISLGSALATSTLNIITEESQSIYITDFSGKIMSIHLIEPGSVEIPVHTFPSGLYFINPEKGNVLKFIKY